MLTVSQII